MQSEYEIVAHNKLKHIHFFLNKITYRTFHLHSDFELFCVMDGCGKINNRSSSLNIKGGDIILINSNQAHEIDAGGAAVQAMILQFSNHFLRDYYPNIQSLNFKRSDICALLPESERAALWQTITCAAAAYVNMEPFFELRCIAAVTRILLALLHTIPYEILSEKEYLQRKKLSQRMNRISSYLEENYQIPVRLRDVAELEQITPTYLSHFFSENFGITFQEYLNNIRFEHAVRLLESSSLSLSDIAMNSGFSELKYMTKMFEKRLGYKPSEFRRRAPAVIGANLSESDSGFLEHRYTVEESKKILNAFAAQNKWSPR